MYLVFTKENCDYCDAAKNLLKSGNIEYVECLLDTPKKIAEFKETTGEQTVPQVYHISGKHIGDYNGLKYYLEVHLQQVVNKVLRGF